MAQVASHYYSGRLTSLEEIFRIELLFAKICGGFQFEWQHLPRSHRSWLAFGYRLALVCLTRYWTPRHFMTSPSLFEGHLSQVTMQNFKLFYYVCQAIGYLMVFVNIRTGFKNQELILVLLKKRYTREYLSQVKSIGRCFPAGEMQHKHSPRTISSSSSSSSIAKLSTDWLSSFRADKTKRSEPEIDPITWSLIAPARTLLTHILLAINLLVAFYSVHVHRGFHHAAGGKIRVNNSSGGGGISDVVSLLNRTNSNTLLGGLRSGEPRVEQVFELDASLLSSSSNLVLAFIQASLNFSQMYGQIFVALLVTSTIADMLRFSMPFDEFRTLEGTSEGGLKTTSKFQDCLESPDGFAITGDGKQHGIKTTTSSSAVSSITRNTGDLAADDGLLHNEYPLTTKILHQAREVLLVLHYTASIEYLLVLLLDLARLGAVVCLLDESILNSELGYRTLPLIGADFVLVLMSITLTRIGHNWLHQEVEKLIHTLERSTVFADWNDEKKINSISRNAITPKNGEKTTREVYEIHSENSMDSKKANQTTALRLAREVITIWPTDWYTPDYGSCIEQVIYLLTFVATFHQIAEASFRDD